ncbi:alpha/beta fold hydrolase [Halomicrococcus gelatinilyticus]|uniref:alpha/beta fold hydrolase n=1 Tax=Halomicrococcus gelatinilyticus TaxID=1702103 RepID=UPI002E0D132F
MPSSTPSTGDRVLFGHSSGGLVALEAARRASVDRLILYEPAILVGEHRKDTGLAARMQEFLDEGEREEAVKLYFRVADGTDDVEQWPIWPDCVALVETMVRENRAIEAYCLDDDLDVSAPALLLTGEEGPEHLRAATQALDDALDDSRLVELDGVGHGGISRAPELVANEVRSFLRETRPS